jgi:broad specificity phosphatase PhoE
MSDLFCAATLLIARHAEAEYDSPLLSDSGGSLSLTGREQARKLGRSLRDARIAMVYCSPMAPAVQTAEIIAAELGAMVRVRDDLLERSMGGSGAGIVERIRGELDTMVDMHRGETVLMVSHDAIVTALPQVLAKLPLDYLAEHQLGACDVVEVAADSDGWVVRSWAGEPV